MPVAPVRQRGFRTEQGVLLPGHQVGKTGRNIPVAPRTDIVLGGIPFGDPPD